jgi:hypothetical protein
MFNPYGPNSSFEEELMREQPMEAAVKLWRHHCHESLFPFIVEGVTERSGYAKYVSKLRVPGSLRPIGYVTLYGIKPGQKVRVVVNQFSEEVL